MTTDARKPNEDVRAAVTLRPLRLSDAPRIRRWMADPSVIDFTVVVPSAQYAPLEPYSSAEADHYLETLVHDATRRSFAIELDRAHVGNVGFKEVQPGSTGAECFIEIGEASARGRGVATAAMTLLLRHGFDVMGLDEVRLGVFEFNGPAIALYRKLGFVDAGSYGAHYAKGRTWTVRAMALSRVRFAARAT